MASGSKAKAGQQQTQASEEEGPKAEGPLRSRKAAPPSEVHHRERSTEDPRRGRVEEEQGKGQAKELGGGESKNHKKTEDTCNQAESRLSVAQLRHSYMEGTATATSTATSTATTTSTSTTQASRRKEL